MKITKTRLKQIIKEEFEATLFEGYISDPEQQKQRAKKFYQQIERLLYDYGQEFRSPNQIADVIMYAASKKGVKELGEPGMPSKENKFDGTRGAATALNNFMDNEDPKLVLAALYKAFIHTKTKKQDMVQYGKQRSKREYDAFAKFSRAGGNVKDLNKPKRRKFLTRSIELVNEEDASTIKAERVVNFIKDHGDTHAELVHQEDGSMKIKVVTKVYDTNTRKMSSEVNYIEPTMRAARRILDY